MFGKVIYINVEDRLDKEGRYLSIGMTYLDIRFNEYTDTRVLPKYIYINIYSYIYNILLKCCRY